MDKPFPLSGEEPHSPGFAGEVVEVFSRIYPLYCLALSPDPEPLVNDFEERLGSPA